MKKSVIIVIGVIFFAIAVAIIFGLFAPPVQQPTTPQADTTPEINRALDELDLGDLDQELQGIDAEIDQL
jgi:hypothetical protein